MLAHLRAQGRHPAAAARGSCRRWSARATLAAPPPSHPAQPQGASQLQLRQLGSTLAAPSGEAAAAGPAGPGATAVPAPVCAPASEAAACLAAAGVDPAQLALEQPAVYARLAADPALARLLAAVVTARRPRGTAGYATLSSADLAARLAFLAGEAGLPLEEIERRYVQRPSYLRFRLEGAQEVLAWLRPHFPDAARLRRVVLWAPQLWASAPAALRASQAALQLQFGLSEAAWAEVVYRTPALLKFKPSTGQGVVDWLRSEAVGLTPEDVLRLFQRRPALFQRAPGPLAAKLEWLLARLELPRDKAAATVLKCTAALLMPQPQLESRVTDLELYGFTSAQVGKLAVETGLLLTCDFERKVQPTLSELEWLLCPFSRPQHAQRAVVAVVLKGGASLLTVPPARLRANFQFLEDQGLSEAQARAVLREAPQVFRRTLTGANMGTKLRYYEEVLGLSARDMLLLHRTYLKEGLEKVDRRVFCMERRGQLQQLLEGGKLGWAQAAPAAFRKRYGISEEECAASEAAWPASERAARYGLAGGEGEKKAGFRVVYRAPRAKTKQAAPPAAAEEGGGWSM